MTDEGLRNGGPRSDGESPLRWSAPRKGQVILRMRGEGLDALSREFGVPIYRLESTAYGHRTRREEGR